MDLDELRAEHERTGLDVGDVDADPFVQVQRWMEQWAAVAPNEPSAVVLATAGADGRPSARTVLLRGFDASGCTVFTSYESRKGQDLAANPHGELLFSWVPLLRQVHLRGPMTRVPREESVAYFATRPRGSQLAAWASHQSRELADRAELEARFEEASRRFEGEDVPCPEHWGGYRLAPAEIELWQGRANRMHDRLRYRARRRGRRRLGAAGAIVAAQSRDRRSRLAPASVPAHGGDETGDEILPVGHRLGVGEVAPHGNGS